jgi:hypothetical protein
MIHFLRFIRQKLLATKQLKRYFAYAFGEIILVMAGILLAFQVDSWNSERQNKEKAIFYLDNIANDMFYQKESLEIVKISYLKNLISGLQFLETYNLHHDFSEIDSLDNLLNTLLDTPSFSHTDNTYSELVSSGQLSLITNFNLVTDIIDYYLYSELSAKNFETNISQIFYPALFPVFNKYTQVKLKTIQSDTSMPMLTFTNESEIKRHILNELESPKNKLELLNAVKHKLVLVDQHLVIIDETLKLANQMISRIDQEIVKLKE